MGATSAGRGLSVASLLALAVLVVTIGSLVATGAVALRAGESGTDEVVRDRLASVRATRAIQLAEYLNRVRVQTATLAGGAMLTGAVERFAAAYRALPAGALGAADERALEAFYTSDFLPQLAQVPAAGRGLGAVLPTTGPAAYLQRYYVADEPAAGERDVVDDAGDGSDWSAVHAELHPPLRDIADQFGYGDLYLIDPERRAIVYSVRKATDFATRLDIGPYSGTSLAGVVTEVIRAPRLGSVRLTDLAAYPPALDRPEAFLASPVHSGTELVGVLAVRLPVDRIDQIMTGGGDWTGEDLGDTGEAFVVGPDQLMRSASREFVQDEPGYLAAAEAAGTIDAVQGERIAVTGSTALVQEIPRPSVTAGTEPVATTSYLGVDVMSTSEPLAVPGLGWTVVTEVSRAELFAPREDYRRALMLGAAVIVIAVTFFAVIWAGRTMRPVRNLSAAVRQLRGGDAGPAAAAVAVPPGSPREFATLAGRVTSMARSLHEGEQRVRDATGQRLALLRSLLPPQIAQRVERGDRSVLDQAPAATVAVLVLSGLGELARSGRTEGSAGGGHRELIGREIEALDDLARQHGMEPVKLTGDAYFAACGLGRLYLDHMVRALRFAVEARDAVRSLRTDTGLDVAAGVATGPVTVGLAGASRLLYDLWGDTVSTAHYLARTARPGQVLTTAEVARVRLPDGLAATRLTDLAESVWEVGPD